MWRHVAASAAGGSHLRANVPCQDAALVRPSRRRIVLAVADGAGSAMYSRCGALLAVRALVEEASGTLSDGMSPSAIERLVKRAFQKTRRAIERAARQFEVPLAEFATTAVLLVATPHLVITGHVGDGGAVLVTAGGEYITVAAPSRGRYANQTFFLTDDAFAAHIKVTVLRQSVLGVAAFTDGVQDQALDQDGKPCSGFLGPAFRWLDELDERRAAAELVQFLKSPELRASTDDDTTLALALMGV